MKATIKKQIERNIRDLICIGDTIPVLNRNTREKQGVLTVTSVSREEIHGTVQQLGENGSKFAGVPAKFRVPQLTQKGGETLLDLAPASA